MILILIKISEIKRDLLNLTDSIKDRGKRMELTRQLDSLQPIKSQIKSKFETIDVSNRICDNILATVASIYLSILFNMGTTTNTTNTTNSFTLALNDFINKKIRNCSNEQRTPEKIKEIIKYYLNVINKINDYLENIAKEHFS